MEQPDSSNLTGLELLISYPGQLSLDSFLKLVKSTLSFSIDIAQVQTRPLKTPLDFY